MQPVRKCAHDLDFQPLALISLYLQFTLVHFGPGFGDYAAPSDETFIIDGLIPDKHEDY
jgi:hypothetical protein